MAILLPLAQAGAATLHVPADYPRIQIAIDDAAAGDTVRVAPGIYSGPGNRDLRLGEKPLTLLGAGPAATLLDCEGDGRGFRLVDADEGTLVRGFAVMNAAAPGGDLPGKGAGILVVGGTPRIERCLFSGGRADYGGGLALEWDAAPRLKACVFRGNRAALAGDDIYSP